MSATARKLDRRVIPVEFSLYCDELLTLSKRAVRHTDKSRLVIRTVVPRMIKAGYTGGKACPETRNTSLQATPEPALPGDSPPDIFKERQD